MLSWMYEVECLRIRSEVYDSKLTVQWIVSRSASLSVPSTRLLLPSTAPPDCDPLSGSDVVLLGPSPDNKTSYWVSTTINWLGKPSMFSVWFSRRLMWAEFDWYLQCLRIGMLYWKAVIRIPCPIRNPYRSGRRPSVPVCHSVITNKHSYKLNCMKFGMGSQLKENKKSFIYFHFKGYLFTCT